MIINNENPIIGKLYKIETNSNLAKIKQYIGMYIGDRTPNYGGIPYFKALCSCESLLFDSSIWEATELK